MGVEGDEVAVDLIAAGELGFVVRLKGEDVEPAVFHRDGAGVLRGDGKVLGDFARGDIDDGDFVFGRERDVGFLVVGEGDADGFVEIGGAFFLIEILNGGDDMKAGRAGGIGIDDTDGIGNVIADPKLFAIGTKSETDGIDADGDALHKLSVLGVDDINGVGGSVGDEEGVV